MAKKPKNERVGRPVRPNVGIRVAYQKRLRALVAEMANSYEHWLTARYRANPPALAQDASAATDLMRELGQLGSRWLGKFREAAPRLAWWFRLAVNRRSDAALKRILKEAGFTVEFKMTPVMRDALDATLAENVGLIKSIPEQYHARVQSIVMQSVAAGRDLATMTRQLRHQFGVTERRAAFIAVDQNNKATGAMMRARQVDLGITEGVWLHSHAGREPRPTHLANHGKRFNLAEGWFDPDPRVRAHILPGQLINCRCTWKPVVKGFS